MQWIAWHDVNPGDSQSRLDLWSFLWGCAAGSVHLAEELRLSFSSRQWQVGCTRPKCKGRVVSDRVTSSLLLLNKVQLHSASVLFSMQAFVSPCSLLRTAGPSNGWAWLSVKWPSRFIDHLGAVDYSQSYRIIAVWSRSVWPLVKRPHRWDSSCFISFSQRSMPSSAKLHISRVWDSLVRSKVHLGPTGVGQRNVSDLLWHFKGPQRHCREAPILCIWNSISKIVICCLEVESL